MNDGRAGKAQHWAEQGGTQAVTALRDALAAIGIRKAMRVADAIARHGSDACITPSGPVLELLSELAEEGEVETFAKAYRLFAAVRPANAGFVRESVPAKISSRYLARHRQHSPSKILSWSAAHPEWPETLKSTVSEPALFAVTVDTMAAAIAEATAPHRSTTFTPLAASPAPPRSGMSGRKAVSRASPWTFATTM